MELFVLMLGKAFGNDNHEAEKKYTVGIEGNNCRLKHRIRRSYGKTSCFSKKLYYLLKTFELELFYINYGYIKNDNHKAGKKYTVGIEGNNCRLRHRIKRSYGKTSCF